MEHKQNWTLSINNWCAKFEGLWNHGTFFSTTFHFSGSSSLGSFMGFPLRAWWNICFFLCRLNSYRHFHEVRDFFLGWPVKMTCHPSWKRKGTEDILQNKLVLEKALLAFSTVCSTQSKTKEFSLCCAASKNNFWSSSWLYVKESINILFF